MISIFPVWTFHLYGATFHHNLHMKCIYLSWYIPVHVVPTMISLIEFTANKEATELKIPSV